MIWKILLIMVSISILMCLHNLKGKVKPFYISFIVGSTCLISGIHIGYTRAVDIWVILFIFVVSSFSSLVSMRITGKALEKAINNLEKL